jgi:Protein of unknown function (DUF4058)
LREKKRTGSSAESIQGLAVLTTPPRTRYVQRAEADAYARKANRVTVRHKQGRVVAVLEIVSPGNKSGRTALHNFVEKMTDLLDQGIHLLIVDLFPPSNRDPQGIHKSDRPKDSGRNQFMANLRREQGDGSSESRR